MSSNLSSSKTSMSTTKQDRQTVLWPRNIRVEDTRAELILRVLEDHRKAAEERIEKFGARKQLEDDGIWLREESPKTKSKIEDALELLNTTPTVEAEWKDLFWQALFFKRGKHSRTILRRWLGLDVSVEELKGEFLAYSMGSGVLQCGRCGLEGCVELCTAWMGPWRALALRCRAWVRLPS